MRTKHSGAAPTTPGRTLSRTPEILRVLGPQRVCAATEPGDGAEGPESSGSVDDDFGVSDWLRGIAAEPRPEDAAEPAVDVGPLELQILGETAGQALGDEGCKDAAFEAEWVACLGQEAERVPAPIDRSRPSSPLEELEPFLPVPPQDVPDEDSREEVEEPWVPSSLPPLLEEATDGLLPWADSPELSASPQVSLRSDFSINWVLRSVAIGAVATVGERVAVAQGARLLWLPRGLRTAYVERLERPQPPTPGLGRWVALAPGPAGTLVGLSAHGTFYALSSSQPPREMDELNRHSGQNYGARLVAERPTRPDPSYAIVTPEGRLHACGPRPDWPTALTQARLGQPLDSDGVCVVTQDRRGRLWFAPGGQAGQVLLGCFPPGVIHVSSEGGLPLVWFAHWTTQPSLRVLRVEPAHGLVTLIAEVQDAVFNDAEESDLSTLFWDADWRRLWVCGDFGLLRLGEPEASSKSSE